MTLIPSRISLAVGALFLAAAGHLPAATPAEHAAGIDRILAAHWQANQVQRNTPVDDETFVRRVHLDLAGRIPTAAEAREFLDATDPNKRGMLIDRLLDQESYVSHFFNYWADILRFKSHFVNTANTIPAAYGDFIKKSLRENKPYDRFVHELLSAKGWAWENGAIGYYHRDPEMPLDNMALTSRVFLGTRIECAQCHDHPFDKWKQTEFYRLAAYTYPNKSINEAYSGARDAIRARERPILDDYDRERKTATDGGKAAEKRKEERMAALHYRKIVGIIKAPVGQLLSPAGLERQEGHLLKLPHDFKEDDGQPFDVMTPAPLFGEAAPVAAGADGTRAFADWITSRDNPRFTKVIVNRLWKKLFGLPVNLASDDLRDSSEAMIPELEAELERIMIDLRYDMRAFLATIARTQAYQSAASPEAHVLGENYHFTGPLLRRMTAEQVWDSFVALARYEPDARDLEREYLLRRRIGVSQMVADAYLEFDGTKLVDMAYQWLDAELKFDERFSKVRQELIEATRTGAKYEVIRDLRHLEGAIDRERGENFVREFIRPLIDHLAQVKEKPVIEDTLYEMNTNPRVLSVETWRKLHIPGYGPAPKTAAEREREAKDREAAIAALAKQQEVPAERVEDFSAYVSKANQEWKRASELESPAPRGHFLRIMGQSDREYVENANPNASIPQALMLMNSEALTTKGLLSPWSPLMRHIESQSSPEAKMDAAYLAILSRKPTAEERAIWEKGATTGLTTIDHLIHALLNTKQFIFVR